MNANPIIIDITNAKFYAEELCSIVNEIKRMNEETAKLRKRQSALESSLLTFMEKRGGLDLVIRNTNLTVKNQEKSLRKKQKDKVNSITEIVERLHIPLAEKEALVQQVLKATRGEKVKMTKLQLKAMPK